MTTKTIFNTFTALALAATLTVGLAACVQAPAAHAPETKPVVTTPAAPVIPALDPGAVVDAGAELSETQKAYALADGTFVVVDASAPLPEPVQVQIEASMASSLSAFDPAAAKGNVDILASEMKELRESEGAATGKTIVTVFRTTMPMTPIGTGGTSYWSLWPEPKVRPSVGAADSWTREDVMALAEQFASEQENPDNVAIVVAE